MIQIISHEYILGFLGILFWHIFRTYGWFTTAVRENKFGSTWRKFVLIEIAGLIFSGFFLGFMVAFDDESLTLFNDLTKASGWQIPQYEEVAEWMFPVAGFLIDSLRKKLFSKLGTIDLKSYE